MNQANWAGNPTNLPTIRQISSIAGRVSTIDINLSSIYSTLYQFSAPISSLSYRVSTLEDLFGNISAGIFVVEQIATDVLSTTIANVPLLNVSTIGIKVETKKSYSLFKAPFTIDLGLGQALGGLLGGLGGAVGGGLIGAGTGVGLSVKGLEQGWGTVMAGRPQNFINQSTFETLNFTTQLQVSTLGSAFPLYSSIFRTVSSISPNEVPGREIFVSTFFYPGTTCIRSISDPFNLMTPDPDLNTSTLQGFGQWVPIDLSGSSPTPVPYTPNALFSSIKVQYDTDPGIQTLTTITSNYFTTHYTASTIFISTTATSWPEVILGATAPPGGSVPDSIDVNDPSFFSTSYFLNMDYINDTSSPANFTINLDTSFGSNNGGTFDLYNYQPPNIPNNSNLTFQIVAPDGTGHSNLIVMPIGRSELSSLRFVWNPFTYELQTPTGDLSYTSTITSFSIEKSFMESRFRTRGQSQEPGSLMIDNPFVGVGFSTIVDFQTIQGATPPIQLNGDVGITGSIYANTGLTVSSISYTGDLFGRNAYISGQLQVSSLNILQTISTIMTDTDLINVSTLNANTVSTTNLIADNINFRNLTFTNLSLSNISIADVMRFPFSTLKKDIYNQTPNYFQLNDYSGASTFTVGYADGLTQHTTLNLDKQGRVGIKTQKPRQTFHVDGTAKMSTIELAHSVNSNQPSIRTSFLNQSTTTSINQYIFQNTYSQYTTPQAATPLSEFPGSNWNTETEPSGYWNNITFIHDLPAVQYTIGLIGYNNSGTFSIINPPGASNIVYQWFPSGGGATSTLITPANRKDTVSWTGTTVSLTSNSIPPRPVLSNTLSLLANESGHYLTSAGNNPSNGLLTVQAPVFITNAFAIQTLVPIGNSNGSATSNIYTSPIIVPITASANITNSNGVATCSITIPIKRILGASNQTFTTANWFPLICFTGWTSAGTSYAMNGATMVQTAIGNIWGVQCVATTNALPASGAQAQVIFNGNALMFPTGVFATF